MYTESQSLDMFNKKSKIVHCGVFRYKTAVDISHKSIKSSCAFELRFRYDHKQNGYAITLCNSSHSNLTSNIDIQDIDRTYITLKKQIYYLKK